MPVLAADTSLGVESCLPALDLLLYLQHQYPGIKATSVLHFDNLITSITSTSDTTLLLSCSLFCTYYLLTRYTKPTDKMKAAFVSALALALSSSAIANPIT